MAESLNQAENDDPSFARMQLAVKISPTLSLYVGSQFTQGDGAVWSLFEEGICQYHSTYFESFEFEV